MRKKRITALASEWKLELEGRSETPGMGGGCRED